MAIGERLAWFRTRANHTQDSLAAASHISRQRISEIERNKKGSPSVSNLEALLNACGVTLGEFFAEDAPHDLESPIDSETYAKLRLILDDTETRPIAVRLIEAVFHDTIRRRELLKAAEFWSDDSDVPTTITELRRVIEQDSREATREPMKSRELDAPGITRSHRAPKRRKRVH